MRFLTVGDTQDLTLVYTAEAARKQGCEVLALDETAFGQDWALSADGQALRFAGGTRLPMAELGPAIVRFTPVPDIPEAAARDQFDRFLYARERRAGMHRFLGALPFPVCNAPGAGVANNAKPLQMLQLAEAGFRIPEWIVTNDAGDAEAFAASHPDAIVKAVSGMRSQVRPFGAAHREALSAGTAPFILQRRIAGLNVRVHAFGPHAFATAVDARGTLDYRFEESDAAWSPAEVPADVAALCRAYLPVEGLLLGGFDFLVADGIWWCLECNPAPTYITYDLSARQPIGATLVQYLLARAEALREPGSQRVPA